MIPPVFGRINLGYFLNLRQLNPARPTKPVPISSMVEGSGTGLGVGSLNAALPVRFDPPSKRIVPLNGEDPKL